MVWASWLDMTEYCGPYCICMSMLIFMLFVNVKIPECLRKTIMFFSSSAVAVYLITDHMLIRDILKSVFSSLYLPHQCNFMGIVVILLFVIVAYIASCIIDKLRIPITNYAQKKILQVL